MAAPELSPPTPTARPTPYAAVVLATSTGGLRALTAVLAALPADFPAPLLIVRHIAPWAPSLAAALLASRTALVVKDAVAGERPRPGVVYLAPPDRHLLVRLDGALALEQSPRVHFTRPAADPLFFSAARIYGRRTIAVVLTGNGGDGAAGARAIAAAGGVVLAQSRSDCEAPGMPAAALATGSVDCTLSLRAIAPALIALCMVPGAAGLLGALAAGPAA